MDIDEFHDFVIDVGLETILKTNPGATPALYTFEMMKEQFSKADKSGKGMAGPAANNELVLYEFLNVITRVSFHRLNPEYGEPTMEHQDTLLPVPQCLEQTLREAILPKAHRDDAVEFLEKPDREEALCFFVCASHVDAICVRVLVSAALLLLSSSFAFVQKIIAVDRTSYLPLFLRQAGRL